MTPFTKRRLLRLGVTLVLAGMFVVIQYWQSGHTVSLPNSDSVTSTSSSTATSASDPKQFFIYKPATTTGVLAHVIRDVDGDTIEVKIAATGEEESAFSWHEYPRIR